MSIIRVTSALLFLLGSSLLPHTNIQAFVAPRVVAFTKTKIHDASFSMPSSSTSTCLQAKRKLVLLTFDLDDTLYPLAPVIQEANAAFAKAMEKYGFTGLKASDIDDLSKQVRQELPPEEAAALSHTEARERAIRRHMETSLLQKKLSETAEDWVTRVEDLSPVVVENAKQWSSRAVADSIVQAVLIAWEMERHHAAERNLYPGVQEVLAEIKEQHPEVIVGAVTDGKANPLLMTFTLAPYFDFCMSWEDDQKGRSQFFKDLASSTKTAQLTWIYNAAVEKGQELAQVQAALQKDKNMGGEGKDDDNEPFDFGNGVWIHVGDDLAYDVGGSAACGAKTILAELADEYQQTARQRFSVEQQPAWSTAPPTELEARRQMNQQALSHVTETIHFIRELPDAIQRIVDAEQNNDNDNEKEKSVAVVSGGGGAVEHANSS